MQRLSLMHCIIYSRKHVLAPLVRLPSVLLVAPSQTMSLCRIFYFPVICSCMLSKYSDIQCSCISCTCEYCTCVNLILLLSNIFRFRIYSRFHRIFCIRYSYRRLASISIFCQSSDFLFPFFVKQLKQYIKELVVI